MNFQPLYDKVLVERLEEQSKTKSGIIIPDTLKEKPMEGRVISAGSGLKDKKGAFISLEVKVGDKILFAKWSGTEVRLMGKEYLVMKEADILGIIKN
jgi:chaperonin GroES